MERKLTLLGTLAALLIPSQAMAQQACAPRTETPTINVEVVDAGVSYDFTKTGNDMMSMANSPPPPGMVLRGLTEAIVETRINIRVSGMGNCAWPSMVRVQLGFFQPQKVFVERNYTQGTCQHQVILGHEHLHVNINRDSVNEMARMLRDGLNQAVMHPSYPTRFNDSAWARDAITRSIGDYINSVSTHFDAVRRSRHAAIDTPDNYRATSAMCNGW